MKKCVARQFKMLQHSGTLTDLIQKGQATIENVNLLLKALSLQVNFLREIFDSENELVKKELYTHAASHFCKTTVLA